MRDHGYYEGALLARRPSTERRDERHDRHIAGRRARETRSRASLTAEKIERARGVQDENGRVVVAKVVHEQLVQETARMDRSRSFKFENRQRRMDSRRRRRDVVFENVT